MSHSDQLSMFFGSGRPFNARFSTTPTNGLCVKNFTKCYEFVINVLRKYHWEEEFLWGSQKYYLVCKVILRLRTMSSYIDISQVYSGSRDSIRWLYSCDKSSYIRSVYSQCHVDLYWAKCKLYVHVIFCLKVIRSWLNLPTVGHGHVICMGVIFSFHHQRSLPTTPWKHAINKEHFVNKRASCLCLTCLKIKLARSCSFMEWHH